MKSESKYETIPSEDIIERTAESLKANGIDVIITDNGVQARQKILEIMPKGANVMAMTSVTLNTVGVTKEIEESEYDFEKAKKTFDDKDYKWSIIKSYYAMFHVARALLFKLGLKEKRHFAISVVLDELNKKGKMERKYVNYFNAGVSSREDVDYHYAYSAKIAQDNLMISNDFKERVNIKQGKYCHRRKNK